MQPIVLEQLRPRGADVAEPLHDDARLLDGHAEVLQRGERRRS